MKGVLADTGPLYALVDPSDQHHRRAGFELRRLATESLAVVVSFSTLTEAYTLVSRRLGTRTALRWLEDLDQGAGLLNPVPEDYRSAIENLSRFPDQRITLTDAVQAVLAERLRMRVWTFDHHFDILGSDVWR